MKSVGFQNNYFCERFCFIAIWLRNFIPISTLTYLGIMQLFFMQEVTVVPPTLKSEGAHTSMNSSKTLTLYAHYECLHTFSSVN